LLPYRYREAAFWHLTELQKAIEEDKLHLRPKMTDADGADIEDDAKSMWWRTALNIPNKTMEEAAAAQEGGRETDWWTGTTYKGVQFLPLSSDPAKVTSHHGQADAMKVPENTWYAYQETNRW
jgi:hypothetical protein